MRHAHQLAQPLVPAQPVQVEEQRAAGVGDIGGVHPATAEPPQQEAVDGPEAQLAGLARVRAGRACESRMWAILGPEK